ncbi:MAG: CopG family transcriptional regulator [Methyloprofundus sp.]|nr:CopG family transcriptional regulator [Methyloprofundus sp.]
MKPTRKKCTNAQLIELTAFVRELLPKHEVVNILATPEQWDIWNAYLKRERYIFLEGQPEQILIDFTKIMNMTKDIPKQPETIESKPIDKPTKRGRGKGTKLVKKVTSIALDNDIYKQLEDLAKNQDRSVGSLIRLAIAQFLYKE